MKKVAYVIIALIGLYLVLCLFGPSTIKVERAIDIKTGSVDDMQHKLADLKFFHDEWSPWTRRDPNMKTSYAGVCCEPGSSYSWESEKDSVGKGIMTFNKFTGDSVLMTLNFDNTGDTKVYYVTKKNNELVNVTWGMIFDINFFGRAPMLFMNMDKMIGPDYEAGLAKLKQVIESTPVESSDAAYKIQEINWEPQTYIGKKGTFKFMELPKFFGENYPKLAEYFAKNNLKMYGAPSAIYFKYDEAKMEAECAAVFITKDKVNAKGWETFDIPASKVLLIEYYGAYDKSIKAHYAMDAYIKEKGLTQNLVIEEYVTDPMSEKDTAKWLTNIYYVLK